MQSNVKKAEEKLITIYEVEAAKTDPDSKNLEHANELLTTTVSSHKAADKKTT